MGLRFRRLRRRRRLGNGKSENETRRAERRHVTHGSGHSQKQKQDPGPRQQQGASQPWPRLRLLFICHKNYSYVNNLNGWLLMMARASSEASANLLWQCESRKPRLAPNQCEMKTKQAPPSPPHPAEDPDQIQPPPPPQACLLRCPMISFVIMSENS